MADGSLRNAFNAVLTSRIGTSGLFSLFDGFKQTAAELAAGVTPVYYYYRPGDIRRFAVLDGVTDDTTAVQNWAKVGGGLTWPVAQTAKITAAIPLFSNTTITAAKGATLNSTSAQISFFTATSKSNIVIDGMNFTQSGTPATLYVAHVSLTGCTGCRVTNCTSTGMCWSGVRLDGCTRCVVDRCYFTGALGALTDRNDICIHDLTGASSSLCEILYNGCYGGGANGILIQDPYASTAPNHNLIKGNRVGTHTQYGIVNYIPGLGNPGVSGGVATGGSATTLVDSTQAWTVNQFAGQPLTVTVAGTLYYPTITSNTATTLTFPTIGVAVVATDPYSIVGDTCNQFIENWVDAITGSEASHSGNGIYSVGAWSGGVVIKGNIVNNCCSATTDRSHLPAGIGVGGPNYLWPTAPVVAHNIVTGMTQGDGILAVLLPGGALLDANEVYIPASNNGAGPGGATLSGSCIRVEQSPLSTISDSKCQCLGTGNSLFVYATAAVMRDITVSAGYYEAAQGAAVRVDQTGGFMTSNLTMTGVRGKHTANAASGFALASVNGGTLSGCFGTAGTQPALAIASCTQLRVSGGNMNSSAPVITTSGTCTGTFIDDSTYFGTSAAGVSNGGTGSIVIWRASAVPAAGTWAVGDTWWQTVPVSGASPGGMCTVAGTPGTWKGFGNLA